MKKYTLTITASCFGSRQDFYKEFSKDNRELKIENVEFEGNFPYEEFESSDPQHNSGYIVEDFETNKPLKEFMKNYFLENLYLEIEYFSIREKGQEQVIFTEENL